MPNSYISPKDQIYLAKLASVAALAIEGMSETAAPAALEQYCNSIDTKYRSGRAAYCHSATVLSFPK